MTDQLAVISFTDLAGWEAWLRRDGSESRGLWVKIAKKGAPQATLGKSEAIGGALCHGWIDGQLGKSDQHHFLIRFTPRRPGSRWSAVNRETAERLASNGRMCEAGRREIDKAMAHGRWETAYAPQSRAEPPADLLAALAANPQASDFFQRLDRANGYAVIYRVQEAKRPETRARRIREYVDMLTRGEAIHPTSRR